MVTGFLSERSTTRESLQKVLSTEVVGSHVAGLTFEDDLVLGVDYVSDNITTLDDLLKFYQADTNYYTQVVSKGISRAKDGTYKLSLSLSLPKENK